MRLIDADATKAFIDNMYKESRQMKDTEFQKILVMCNEIIKMQPTASPEVVNEKYMSLDYESRKALDLLIDCMHKETLKRNDSK